MFVSGVGAMADSELEARLEALTSLIVSELIALTPASMSEIQFEIVATADDGADIGLLENNPDVTRVALSNPVYDYASWYLPLVKQYVPGWRRSLITLRQSGDGWQASVKFERG
jgi:hypothetical protein